MVEEENEAAPSSQDKRIRPAYICLALAVVPFIALLYKTWHHGLPFPYWDAWEFIHILEKSRQGALSFGDFWMQHNEHRVVVPRLVMFALAKMSGWNVAWEIVGSLVLGTTIFLLCCRLAFRGRSWREGPWWAVPLFSLLVFSWVQMENWVWGWEINTFLNTTGVLAAAVLLTGPALTPLRFVLALLFTLVASFSFANGLLAWIALAPLVFLAVGPRRETRIIYSLLWIAAGILAIQLYLINYADPEVSPDQVSPLEAPHRFLAYVALYIGAPITGMFTQPAWHGNIMMPTLGVIHYIAGTLSLIALAILLVAILRRDRQNHVLLLPWVGIILYVLGSAAVTAWGRCGYGLAQALTSRYMTMSSLYWYGLVGVLLVYLQGRTEPVFPGARTRKLASVLGAVALLVLLYLSHQNQRGWEQLAHWKQMGWTALRAGHMAPLYLQDLAEDPVALRDSYVPMLRAAEWCGFENEPNVPAERADDFVDEAERLIQMGLYLQAKTYLETAFILDPEHARARERYEQLRAIVQGSASRSKPENDTE